MSDEAALRLVSVGDSCWVWASRDESTGFHAVPQLKSNLGRHRIHNNIQRPDDFVWTLIPLSRGHLNHEYFIMALIVTLSGCLPALQAKKKLAFVAAGGGNNTAILTIKTGNSKVGKPNESKVTIGASYCVVASHPAP